MKEHNKLIKSTAVAEKTDLWDNFIVAILARTGLHSLWFSARVGLKRSKPPLCVAVAICPKGKRYFRKRPSPITQLWTDGQLGLFKTVGFRSLWPSKHANN